MEQQGITNMVQMQPQQWLTEKQAAEQLQVSRETLARARRDGAIEYTKADKKSYRYKQEWLEAYMNNRKNSN